MHPAIDGRTALLGLLLVTLTAALRPSPVAAGTAFGLQAGDRMLVGKNEDGISGDAALIVNPRGLMRQAAPPRRGKPARWVARYGSVTFNRHGPGFPSGGLNEAGLVVESLRHDDAQYPDPDGRPALGCLEWVQYQLDTAASIDDVIAGERRVRIDSVVPLHFLVADDRGRVAAVEFVDGRAVVDTGAGLPVRVLSDATYAAALRHLAALDSAGRAAGDGIDSLARFARAARRVHDAKPPPASDPLALAFATLAEVTQGSFTEWSIVYDLGRRRVHFRTRRRPQVRHLDLQPLDFHCTSPSIGVDLDAELAGPIDAALRPLPPELDRAAVRSRSTEIVAPNARETAELERRAGQRPPARCLDR